MEESAYRVNIDYCYELYDPNYNHKKYEKINHELEFFYFFSNETIPLFTTKKYSSSYLRYLSNFGITPQKTVSKCKNVKNWFADLTNFELAKKLNSKLFLHEIKNGSDFEDDEEFIFKGKDEFDPCERAWFFRSPYDFSGRGHIIISTKEDTRKLDIHKEYLVSPLRNRLVDIGVSVDEKGRYQIYFNEILNNGQFRGITRYLSEKQRDLFLQAIDTRLPAYFKTTFLTKIPQVITFLESKGIYGPYQFDNYIFQLNGIQSALLIEINYRKTMANMLELVSKRFNPADKYISLKMLKNANDSREKIVISPEENRFKIVYDSL